MLLWRNIQEEELGERQPHSGNEPLKQQIRQTELQMALAPSPPLCAHLRFWREGGNLAQARQATARGACF